MNDFGSAAGTGEIISLPHSKRENVFAAVVAFATMTLDFESFKFNYGLHGMLRGEFTVAAGQTWGGNKGEAPGHFIEIQASVYPAKTNGPYGCNEPGSGRDAP